MTDDIAFEADYPQSPEVVWRAIATHEGLSAWLMENDFTEPRVGAEFQFRDRPRPFWNGICDCKVVEAEPARKLKLLWNFKQDAQPTTVSWTLTRNKDGGTHLAFRHSGFHGFMGMIMRKGMQRGWEGMVKRTIPFVARHIAEGKPLPTRDEVKAYGKATKAAA
jgi:uncharacterized protein YndB with AHSA1/START domain